MEKKQMNDAIEPLWTADDVARYLKLAKNGSKTVLSWVRQGKLRALRAGDLYRFRKLNVDEFLELNIR